MTLLERCQDLRQQIAKRNFLRLANKDAEGFRERTNDLRLLRESLANTLSIIKVFRTRGIPMSKVPDPTTALTSLQVYQQKLVDGESEVGKDFGRLKRSIEKVG